jgi:N-methylhydantoinase A/oxoprolinase/acetone carboxylase beta subunit
MDRPIEIVNIRVKSIGLTQKITLNKGKIRGIVPPKQACLKKQNLFFEGKKRVAPVYKREFLEPGNRIFGPALIVDQDATTFLPPPFRLHVDGWLNLIVDKSRKSDG